MPRPHAEGTTYGILVPCTKYRHHHDFVVVSNVTLDITGLLAFTGNLVTGVTRGAGHAHSLVTSGFSSRFEWKISRSRYVVKTTCVFITFCLRHLVMLNNAQRTEVYSHGTAVVPSNIIACVQ